MLTGLKTVFTRRRMTTVLAAAAFFAAATGWKLGSGDAIGRYLAAPVAIVTPG